MAIEVHEYDPAWPEHARRAIDELTTAAGGWLTVIEHIGSTSVPGLAAKPIIDLMAAAQTLDDPAAEEAVVALGYRRMEFQMPQRLSFKRYGPEIGYHLHVVLASSWDTRNQRLFRDHLREHPADRDAYAELKRTLAGATHEGDSYTRAKTALVQRIVDAARDSRGLPRVDVWEE
ncbi:GrpB family protein [Actinoplanes sp. NPDC051633]|uniref:GrpB family protein n=1 Tax=Actinoplanes sp. NPDC051633 TaxID=3155670 RepID=UPI00342DBB86